MSEFTDRELKLLINSTHERAMRLLTLSHDMSRVGYQNSTGREPTMADIKGVGAGHEEHLALVAKLQEQRQEDEETEKDEKDKNA